MAEYFTNYRTINKNGVVSTFLDQICYRNLPWDTATKIEILVPLEDLPNFNYRSYHFYLGKSSSKFLRYFSKALIEAELPHTFSIEKKVKLSYQSTEGKASFDTDCGVFSLDISKYKCIGHVKFTLDVIRKCWEEYAPNKDFLKLTVEAYKLYKKDRKKSKTEVNILEIMQTSEHSNSSGGHQAFWGHKNGKIGFLDLEELNEIFARPYQAGNSGSCQGSVSNICQTDLVYCGKVVLKPEEILAKTLEYKEIIIKQRENKNEG